MDTKFCCDCGAKIPASARFCSSCGEKQISVDSISSKPEVTDACVTASEECAPVKVKRVKVKKEKKPSKFNKKGLIPLIRNGILLVVATLMLIMAFMPVTKISISDAIGIVSDDIPELEMDVTPVRAISIMFASFKSNDMEDMEDDLYKLLEEIQEEYEDEFDELDSDGWDDLSRSEQKTITDVVDTLFYKMFKLALSVEDMSIAPQLYVAGVLSFLYIAAAVALLVVAILNMLSTFKIIKSEKGSLLKWTALLLTIIPVFVIVLNYIYNTTLLSAFRTSANNTSLAGCAIATVVICSIAIIGLFVLRLIFAKERSSVSVMIRRGIALAVSIVVICLAFTPILKTTYEITPSNSYNEREFEYSINTSFYIYFGFLTEDEWDSAEEFYNLTRTEKQEYFESLIDDMEYLTKKELNSAEGNLYNSEFVSGLYHCYIGEAVIITPLLMLCQLVAVIGAGFVMWQMLRYFAIGRINRKFVLSGRLLAVIFGAGAVASNIVLAILAAYATKRYAPDGFTCSIALGVFFFLAFAIVMLVLPISAKRDPEENTIPMSMFCGSAACACCCGTVCEEAPVDEAPVAEEASFSDDDAFEENLDEAPASEDTADEAEELTDSDDTDIQDIEDLKSLDGAEE